MARLIYALTALICLLLTPLSRAMNNTEPYCQLVGTDQVALNLPLAQLRLATKLVITPEQMSAKRIILPDIERACDLFLLLKYQEYIERHEYKMAEALAGMFTRLTIPSLFQHLTIAYTYGITHTLLHTLVFCSTKLDLNNPLLIRALLILPQELNDYLAALFLAKNSTQALTQQTVTFLLEGSSFARPLRMLDLQVANPEKVDLFIKALSVHELLLLSNTPVETLTALTTQQLSEHGRIAQSLETKKRAFFDSFDLFKNNTLIRADNRAKILKALCIIS